MIRVSAYFAVIPVLILGLGGCKAWKGEKAGESVTLLGSVDAKWVEVDEKEMGVEKGPMGKAARRILDARIQESRRFRLGKAKGGAVLNLFISVIPGSMSPETPAGTAAAETGPDAESAPGKSFEAIHVLKYKGEEGWPLSTAIVVRAGSTAEIEDSGSLGQIVSELVGGMERQVDLLHADMDAVRKALQDEDNDVVSLAVQILGEKKDRESVPALCAMLEKGKPNEPVLEDIIGALGKIGDREATPYLIRAFSGAESWQEVQIIHALAMTGGQEARQFLEAVASGHEYEHTRQMARDSLEQIQE
ncbi:MAG: HEAT repeat domain-containing protein [Pseudomonadota bacterium]